jgi:protein-S-isoprenylcysteine O-methyltransferase Ste14
MTDAADRSNAIIRPAIAWALAFLAGLALDWLYPLRVVAASVPAALVGGVVFAAGFALGIWAIVTIRKAGSQVETTKPTTAIVTGGPYRFTRNPIYIGMFPGQTGLGIGFDSLWVLAMLVPFYLVIRYCRRRPRGGLSRAQVQRSLSRLQVRRAPLALSRAHSCMRCSG